ncbi:hypothetical protein AAFF_G00376640 [Aldrovandia affinis]|uniref:Uncharacterized protein n=1 Tax=Aldrovandia affinis TaxID=143900 RepID=A0AAD7SFU4_9TELE|nr:hypothetical protein AAFF_G00376640 [Aldrovandia affinis]
MKAIPLNCESGLSQGPVSLPWSGEPRGGQMEAAASAGTMGLFVLLLFWHRGASRTPAALVRRPVSMAPSVRRPCPGSGRPAQRALGCRVYLGRGREGSWGQRWGCRCTSVPPVRPPRRGMCPCCGRGVPGMARIVGVGDGGRRH